MKKFLAILMTLCLLCGATVLAEELGTNNDILINQDSDNKSAATTVSYTIAENASYIVTIPASLPLAMTSWGKPDATLPIKLDATNFNVNGKQIAVKLSTAETRVLTGATSKRTIPYNISKNSSTLVPIENGTAILTWSLNSTNRVVETSVYVFVPVLIDATLPADTYSDTITFTVSVTDINANEEIDSDTNTVPNN